jgi:hypothetical protein
MYMTEKKALDLFGAIVMTLLLVAGLGLFLSGLRFISPFDAAFRFISGGVAVIVSGRWLWKH